MSPGRYEHPHGPRAFANRGLALRLRAFFSIVLVACAVTVAAAEDSGPKSVVETLHAALLKAMKGGKKLGYKGRVELMTPVLEETFDFDAIARIVTGRYWSTVSEAERQKFIAVFKRLSSATYATNFSGYSGEHFETLGTQPARGTMIVKTVLVENDGDRVSLDYMLRQSHGKWLIVNVTAQGVSDLSLKRADYTAVIQSEGFDSLLKRLNEKVAEMDAKG